MSKPLIQFLAIYKFDPGRSGEPLGFCRKSAAANHDARIRLFGSDDTAQLSHDLDSYILSPVLALNQYSLAGPK